MNMTAFLPSLVTTVQYNRDIADARHAREMRLCNHLLQMQKFCRWQLELPDGVQPDRPPWAEWIRVHEAR